MSFFKVPACYPDLNAFTNLKAALGGSECKAKYLWLELWTRLATDAYEYGRVGYLAPASADAFRGLLDMPEREQSVDLLVSSGVLAQRPDGLFCELFAKENVELDEQFIKGSHKSHQVAKYKSLAAAMERSSVNLVTKMASTPEFWEQSDGRKLTEEEMNLAVVLIRTVDGIVGRVPRRFVDDFTAGLIQSAHRVGLKYQDGKLAAILMRMYLKRNVKGLPRDTGLILQRFDDIVFLIMPEEGWEHWKGMKGYEKS